jgi:tetratricopeptide (TPR) repeat protein
VTADPEQPNPDRSNPALPGARPARVLLHHAGPDAVWAQWLARRSARLGHPVGLLRAEGSAEGLERLLERGTEPGDVLVLVLSRALLDAHGCPERDWVDFTVRAEERGIRLLPVLLVAGHWPAALDRLPAVDLRACDEHDAEARFARALGTVAADGDAQRMIRVGEAEGLSPGRYPGLTPRHLGGEIPEPRREWFFGRDEQFDTIRMELERTGRVALSGTPSTGKTWLAAEYLHRWRSQYDVVAWIRADQGAMIREDLGRLAKALGVAQEAGIWDAYRAVADALRCTEERFLLVFDNALPDHLLALREQALIPGEKPAVLSELVPSDGRGHVLYTSVSGDWNTARTIPVRPFSAEDGARFLRWHVAGLAPEVAAAFSEAVGGSPWALNIIGHVLIKGSVTAQEYLQLVRENLAEVLEEDQAPDYRVAHSVFMPTMRLLLESPDPDAQAAAQLLRQLTAFAAEPVPLDLLTSQMDGTRYAPYGRLPADLAAALARPRRREAVLGHITQLSLASVSPDRSADGVPLLAMHQVTRDLWRTAMNRRMAEDTRHAAHRLLCDADPHQPYRPDRWPRYLQLWRNLVPMRALECDRVADPRDPCSALPGTVTEIIHALQAKGELAAAVQLAEAALEAWSARLGEGDLALAFIRRPLFLALWHLEMADEALEQVELILRRIGPVREEYPDDYVHALNGRAACLRAIGKWAQSLESDREAYQWAVQSLDPGRLPAIRAGHNYAVALRTMGRFAQALEIDTQCYARSMERADAAFDSTLALHSFSNIAQDRRELGEYDAAVRLGEQVLDRMQRYFGDRRQPYFLMARKDMAIAQRKAGHYPQAFELSRELVQDYLAVYGREHFETAAAHNALANDLRSNKRYAEAEREARFAYETCAGLAEDHPFTAACAVGLAAALRALDRGTEAMELDEEAVRILTARLGEQHPYTLAALTDLATDLAAAGRTAEAVILGERTLELSRSVRGAEHPYTLLCAANLAFDLRSIGRDGPAGELLRETLGRYVATLGGQHPLCVAAREGVRATAEIEPAPM